jgi:PhnB protein
MLLQPYLFFDGRCDEALAFYKRVLGAKVGMLMRFKDSPDPASCPPGAGDKVMHAEFSLGDTVAFASDGHCSGKPEFKGFGLSVTAETEAEARKAFDALGEGGQVQMPMARSFFSPAFGMLTDKFGVLWMVLVKQ